MKVYLNSEPCQAMIFAEVIKESDLARNRFSDRTLSSFLAGVQKMINVWEMDQETSKGNVVLCFVEVVQETMLSK